MEKVSEQNCSGCKFAVFIDEGYSNYTVEGTEFFCGKNVHPDGHFDRWYGKDKRLEFAQNCPKFEGGLPIEMDVEKDNISNLSIEQLAIYIKTMTRN